VRFSARNIVSGRQLASVCVILFKGPNSEFVFGAETTRV